MWHCQARQEQRSENAVDAEQLHSSRRTCWSRLGRGPDFGPSARFQLCARTRSPAAGVGSVSVHMWAGLRSVPVQMWQGWAQSRCRCGSGEPTPGVDVVGLSPLPVQDQQRCMLTRAQRSTLTHGRWDSQAHPSTICPGPVRRLHRDWRSRSRKRLAVCAGRAGDEWTEKWEEKQGEQWAEKSGRNANGDVRA
jgi:hypothetical protein